jgi:hypothetical protein
MIEKLWKSINVKEVQHIVLFTMISGIEFFVSLLHLTESMITSDNSSHFKAATFVSQYLHNNNNNNSNDKNKMILV